MQMPERIEQSDVQKGKEMVFGYVHEQEAKAIRSWLVSVANGIVGEGAGVERVKEVGKACVEQVRSVFGGPLGHHNAILLSDAQRGRLASQAPPASGWRDYVLPGALVLGELAVPAWQFWVDASPGAVFYPAGLLVVGGALAGRGLAALKEHATPLPAEYYEGDDRPRVKRVWAVIEVLGGLLGIVGAGLMRAGSDDPDPLVIAVTIVGALLLAIAEAVRRSARSRRAAVARLMFLANTWHATRKHDDACGDGGVYLRVYSAAAHQIHRDEEEALRWDGAANAVDHHFRSLPTA